MLQVLTKVKNEKYIIIFGLDEQNIKRLMKNDQIHVDCRERFKIDWLDDFYMIYNPNPSENQKLVMPKKPREKTIVSIMDDESIKQLKNGGIVREYEQPQFSQLQAMVLDYATTHQAIYDKYSKFFKPEQVQIDTRLIETGELVL